MTRRAVLIGGAALALIVSGVAGAGSAAGEARAVMKDADGKQVGSATLKQTPTGVLIRAEFTGLAPGVHAFHVHETGVCTPPFKSAGGHFNPTGKQHGLHADGGHHAGDLPNIHVPESGALTVEVMADALSLREGEHPVLDKDGAALVVHAGADDYASDPAGSAGARVACGVIE